MTREQMSEAAGAVAEAVDKAGSVRELADALMVSRQTVYNWLHAKTPMSAEHAKRMARTVGMSFFDFRPDLREVE